MIKVTNDTIKVSGGSIQIMVELTWLMNTLVELGCLGWEDLHMCLETAKLPPEQFNKKLESLFYDLLKNN